MIKDPHYWNTNYDIITTIHGFSDDYKKRIHEIFFGRINFIIFERSNRRSLYDHIDMDRVLMGWLPIKGSMERSGYDFILTPEILYQINVLKNELKPITDIITFLHINCKLLGSGLIQVEVDLKNCF